MARPTPKKGVGLLPEKTRHSDLSDNDETRPLNSRASDEYLDTSSVIDDIADEFNLSDVDDLDPEHDLLSSQNRSSHSASRNNPSGPTGESPVSSQNSGPQLPYRSFATVEGSSSQIPQAIVDLELQQPAVAPPRELTIRERLVNAAHALFPIRQTYGRLSNGIATGRLQPNTPGRFVGQGTDGVFRNLAAKPDRQLEILGRELLPPTYEEAAADATPEYWELGVVNPAFGDEVFVRGLPVGTFCNMLWNALMTIAFKMIAFVLCYLLHTSHAAKEGARVGFGAMLIMYGHSILPTNLGFPDRIPSRYQPPNANSVVERALLVKLGGPLDTYALDISRHSRSVAATFGSSHEPYLAYAVIAFGVFTILLAFVNFYQVKQDEKKILAPPPQQEQYSNTEAIINVPE
ncbi:hypothetical protein METBISCDRAFT_28465 [Metschnikowia bicuspidata]|uniref:Uncharacterized protein n=1 Tax=Metschnikowia bicuspidata TaxID=27322 RepID=A0A4P9ZBH2_9ASCO|nr:hypothetical protein METBISCDRAFT_28465 [Metschnikowia bicuspidata]